ncbi:hypothetical protein VTK73DRAFT_9935 [Phialemonium thermophilum]|uniref:Pentapeptide repeat-containing protein n=1 Tax=Phialemonium thermophilum TaxID=223376 RepID=A0ABR3VZF9_9PEZI
MAVHKTAALALGGLFALLAGVARASIGDCTNVTLATQADADAVGQSCKVIHGDLVVGATLNGTIVLDAVETITGSLVQWDGCSELTPCTPMPGPLSLALPSLTHINDSLYFWNSGTLEELRVPRLERVERSVALDRQTALRRLDITKLAYFGSLTIDAENLTDVRHDDFKGFTRGFGYVALRNALVDSVDSFFRNPIYVEGNDALSGFSFNSYGLPNVRHLTLGWSRLPDVDIVGKELAVTLGADHTTSLEIDRLKLSGNFTAFERAPSLKNLTVGSATFTMLDMLDDQDLSLAFDAASEIYIGSVHARHIRNPPAAVHWADLGLAIQSALDLNLSSQYAETEDGEREKIWYWPDGDMRYLHFDAVTLGNPFFDDFVARRDKGNDTSAAVPKVLEDVKIFAGPNSTFNCSAFDKLHDDGVILSDYSCYVLRKRNAALAQAVAPHRWILVGIAVAGGAVLQLL